VLGHLKAIGNKAPIELIDRPPKLAGKSPAAWSKDGELSTDGPKKLGATSLAAAVGPNLSTPID